MPISNLASYLPTMDELIAHWSAVNRALDARGEPPAVLRDGCGLAQFEAARDHLEAVFRTVESARSHLQTLREAEEYTREALRARLVQFRDRIWQLAPETPYAACVAALPPLEGRGAALPGSPGQRCPLMGAGE
jgi:hypothetical protein